MEISCLQSDLSKGLAIVRNALAAKSTLPVLSNFLLTAQDGYLILSATDLELGLVCWVDALDVQRDGATTAPARTLIDLVNALPDETVELDLAAGALVDHLSLRCGRYANTLHGLNADKFPRLVQLDGKPVLVAAAEMRRVADQVAFAAETGTSRPILAGMLARLDSSGLTFAASDGFRLSVRTVPVDPMPAADAQPQSAIIPARSIVALGRVMGSSGEGFGMQLDPVQIYLPQPGGAQQVQFQLDNVFLTSQLVDGNYFDYSAIIPKRHTTRLVVGVRDLARTLRVGQVFARESASIVRLSVAPGGELSGGTVAVKAVAAETGDSAGVVDADVEGEPLEIALNCKYLLDLLDAAGADKIAMEMTTASSPVAARLVGDPAFVHVIMPMHLASGGDGAAAIGD